jgi:hypothetical protein
MEIKNKILFSIVVHDPKIINFLESHGKYKCLPNYNYILVGKHDRDYSSEKIIQCDKFSNNIESQNYFLAYTAWWLLANNTYLIPPECEYLCLLEYDVEIINESDVEKFCDFVISNNKILYGIDKINVVDCFLQKSIFCEILLSFLKHNQIKELKTNNNHWIVSNNVIFRKDFFIEYMNNSFTKEFFKFLKNDPMSGHNLERFLSVYCFLNDINFDFVDPKLFHHKSLDSHDTQGKNSYNSFIQNLT